ncbi:MAG: class I SAM-dependent methyltransferase, partial [Candidatus Hadarchaeota archaeon]
DFEVVGIEISKTAYSLAQKYDPETVFHNEDVLEFTSKRSFDSIYGFNILHLFRESERKRLVNQWYGNLRKGGLIFMVFFSNEEHSYGKGRRVEENTFESKQGRPVHYFTKDDLKNHFKDFQIIETESIEERENHGEKGPHIHNLRYIFARKG